MMTQRFRVRLEPLPATELMPERARVTDVDSGANLGERIPIEYAPDLLAAAVGQAVEVDLYDESGPVYDPVTRAARREPAVLLVVERTS
jgi:hypothetical protein